MKGDLHLLCWPPEKLGEAILAIARQCGFASQSVAGITPMTFPSINGREALERQIEVIAESLGLEAEPVESSYSEIDHLLLGAGPALLRLPCVDGIRFLAILDGKRAKMRVIAPDLRIHHLPVSEVRHVLFQELESPLVVELDRLLSEAGVHPQAIVGARGAILGEQLSQTRIGDCWLLRTHPGSNFRRQFFQAKLHYRLARLVALYTCQYALAICSWWILGGEAIGGELDRAWLLAWTMLLFTGVPFQLLAAWTEGVFSINTASLIKQRLLYGALRIDPEKIKHQGAGQLLGRIAEATAVESLALRGGFLGIASFVELITAALVIRAGVGGNFQLLFFCLWVLLSLFVCWFYFRRRQAWTLSRVKMTNDLTERMIGHRTRLAQESREHWHDGEDQIVEEYIENSKKMDRVAVIQGLLPRGWIVLGLIGIAFVFVNTPVTPAAIAVGLGGILLALRSLGKLMESLSSLLSLTIVWQQAAELFQAAAKPNVTGSQLLAARFSQTASGEKQTVMEASDLVFRYRKYGEPVIRGCNLEIRQGDKILLEGASGGGKSTLGLLLAGIHLPESGLLLSGGLDYKTVGTAEWRQRVVLAPQFHENHVFTGTFAFNLLMGRGWPPGESDLEDAESICRELGLGDLLERMPAGLLQMVGESGWQLSHGERSRLYVARALLQNADLVILDESFAALDPETLQQCLRCVRGRAKTLLVIAHP